MHCEILGGYSGVLESFRRTHRQSTHPTHHCSSDDLRFRFLSSASIYRYVRPRNAFDLRFFRMILRRRLQQSRLPILRALSRMEPSALRRSKIAFQVCETNNRRAMSKQRVSILPNTTAENFGCTSIGIDDFLAE